MQPGVMLYFEVRPCLHHLSDEEKGQLFEAILDYGECGTVPDFQGVLAIAWDFIMPRLDRDRETYLRKCSAAQRAAEGRWKPTTRCRGQEEQGGENTKC